MAVQATMEIVDGLRVYTIPGAMISVVDGWRSVRFEIIDGKLAREGGELHDMLNLDDDAAFVERATAIAEAQLR